MEDILTQLGLTAEEAKTYLAILSLGPSTIVTISQKSGLPRSTTYLLTEGLKLKGLISLSSIGKKMLFVPLPPEQLGEIVKQKQENLEELQRKLASSLPQFNSLYNSMPQKPKVFFYEGFKGIKTIFNQTLKTKEILVLCSGYDKPMDKKMDDFQEKYFKNSDDNKIKTYELIGGGLDSQEYIDKYNGKLHQIKLYPFKSGLQHIDKLIFGNSLAVISYEYLNGVVIENASIVDFEKEIFWQLWKEN